MIEHLHLHLHVLTRADVVAITRRLSELCAMISEQAALEEHQ